ncbi:hypothetical protein CY34DRAFT_814501 [Suillus luteus UH-Slu-Lm8-n1]|uniref:Uncharacterized protein n=1 Tax=Suillus luteus UH-Slu-Lm8-n1 TaxID=930992 RepID=A0A0D0AC70_9AGAM|nr:hypothetical protein CY34DRAFT_814501 [Suillus luteus UH-Slu-Lm8-n1]
MVRQQNIISDRIGHVLSQSKSAHRSELINAPSYGIPAANLKLQRCDLTKIS